MPLRLASSRGPELGWAWRTPARRFPRNLRGAGAGPVTFGVGGTLLRLRVLIALGADLSADPSTWAWEDITYYVRQPDITVTEGRRDQASLVDTSRGVLALNNTDGRFCRRNTSSPYYGLLSRNTPIWIQVDPGSGWYDLGQLFVNEWPTRWDDTLAYSMVPIQCAGIMRRLATATVTLDPEAEFAASALSVITPGNIVAYWPCTDEEGATSAASTIATVPALETFGTVTFGQVDPGSGKAKLPDVSGGGRLDGLVPTGTVTTEWTIECVAKGVSGATDYVNVLTVDCAFSPSARTWVIRYQVAGTITVHYIDSAGVTTTAVTAAVDPFDDTFRTLQLRCRQNGGNVDVALYVDGVAQGTATPTVTLTRPTHIYGSDGRGHDLSSVGQIKVFESFTPVGSTLMPDLGGPTVLNGWNDEQAHARMARICAQAGIPFHCLTSTSVYMGVARSGTLLEQLRECEAADNGVLYEFGWGLAYQGRGERENAAVALALDFAQGHIADPPEPADDDQTYHNQWTISRTGGSSAVARLADEVIAAEGLHPDSATLNVFADNFCYPNAGWRVWRDSVDEDRWPVLALELGSPTASELIPTWVGLPFGARTTAVNLPVQTGPTGHIDAFIEGRSQRVDPFSWRVALNLAPASPFDVLLLAESSTDPADGLGRLESTTCSLDVAVSTSATSWSVSTVPLATTDVNEHPYDMFFGGERITVSSKSGAANPQTWTVVRSVNGVVAAHPVGTAGLLADPLIPVLSP